MRVSACSLLIALATLNCTNLTGLGVGPVAARSEQHVFYGDELRGRAGLGSSERDGVVTADLGARLLVTEQSQLLGVDVGPAYGQWLGRGLVTLRASPGLAVERYVHKGFFDASLQAGAGVGWTLDEQAKPAPSWLPWPEVGLPDADRFANVERKRSVLTLELTGGLDARGTRSPLWTAGLLIGLSFFNEVRTEPRAPVLPWPLLRR